jgi:hypothetical protein
MPTNSDRQREETLRRFQRQQALKAAAGNRKHYRFHAWKTTALEETKRKLSWLGPVVGPINWLVVKPVKWATLKLYHAAIWTVPRMFTRRDKTTGRRHFAPIRSAFAVAALAACAVNVPHVIPEMYYYGTARTHQIYVPNAGVFHNQQFERPDESGHVITPRDEIFTVLGRRIEDGRIEQPTRYEVDANPYFLFVRPDLAAAEMTPGSPYGATCTAKATGLYTVVPRYFRASRIIRWLNIRPEIVALEKDPGLIAWGYPRNPEEQGQCHQVTAEEFSAVFSGEKRHSLVQR